MTYPPPPPGNGGQFPPPSDPYQPNPPVQPYQQPYQPVQPYQPPQSYVPDNNPFAAPQPYDYGYGSPYSKGYGPPAAKPPTEGLAIASLVISCVAVAGLCTWGVGGLLGVVGAVMGHTAQRKIRAGGLGGQGLATAGIVVGWLAAVIGLIVIAVIVFSVAADSSSY